MKFIFLGLFLTACTENKGLPSNSNDSASENQSEPSTEIFVETSQAFRVPERSWDLAVHPDGRIFCSTQSGSKLYAWDPETELREEEPPNYSSIQALFIPNDEEIYYTTTEYGVTGTLSRMIDHSSEILVTQADDGTLIRWPMDLIQAPDGGWLIADYEDHSVFWVHNDNSVTRHAVGADRPEALVYQEPYLYIGGEDGLYKMEWPNGESEKVSERPTFGLELVNDDIWAGTLSGVYSISGVLAEITDVARGGSLVFSQDVLYLGDKVGEGVWRITIP
jgi:WD40 repeat protein